MSPIERYLTVGLAEAVADLRFMRDALAGHELAGFAECSADVAGTYLEMARTEDANRAAERFMQTLGVEQ